MRSYLFFTVLTLASTWVSATTPDRHQVTSPTDEPDNRLIYIDKRFHRADVGTSHDSHGRDADLEGKRSNIPGKVAEALLLAEMNQNLPLGHRDSKIVDSAKDIRRIVAEANVAGGSGDDGSPGGRDEMAAVDDLLSHLKSNKMASRSRKRSPLFREVSRAEEGSHLMPDGLTISCRTSRRDFRRTPGPTSWTTRTTSHIGDATSSI
jgi:hypothetical protein